MISESTLELVPQAQILGSSILQLLITFTNSNLLLHLWPSISMREQRNFLSKVLLYLPFTEAQIKKELFYLLTWHQWRSTQFKKSIVGRLTNWLLRRFRLFRFKIDSSFIFRKTMMMLESPQLRSSKTQVSLLLQQSLTQLHWIYKIVIRLGTLAGTLQVTI